MLLLNELHDGLRHIASKYADRIDIQLHSVLLLVQGNEIGIPLKSTYISVCKINPAPVDPYVLW